MPTSGQLAQCRVYTLLAWELRRLMRAVVKPLSGNLGAFEHPQPPVQRKADLLAVGLASHEKLATPSTKVGFVNFGVSQLGAGIGFSQVLRQGLRGYLRDGL